MDDQYEKAFGAQKEKIRIPQTIKIIRGYHGKTNNI